MNITQMAFEFITKNPDQKMRDIIAAFPDCKPGISLNGSCRDRGSEGTAKPERIKRSKKILVCNSQRLPLREKYHQPCESPGDSATFF